MEYNFPIFDMKGFMAEQDLLDVNNILERTSRSVNYDSSCDKLVNQIQDKIYEIKYNDFQPEFILLNTKNYERLIAWLVHKTGNAQPPDDFMGCRVVVWDVPIDYVNVRAKASDEWAYGDSIRKGAAE